MKQSLYRTFFYTASFLSHNLKAKDRYTYFINKLLPLTWNKYMYGYVN